MNKLSETMFHGMGGVRCGRRQPSEYGHGRCRSRGFSYAEVMVSVVIISVLLMAALRLFGNLGRSRLHTLDQDSANLLALEMIQEIKQKPYQDSADAGALGPEPDETPLCRADFDDMDDYHGWAACPPQNEQGEPQTQYDGLTRSVSLRYVAANDFSLTVAENEGFKEVAITIMRDKVVISQQKYVIADAPLE